MCIYDLSQPRNKMDGGVKKTDTTLLNKTSTVCLETRHGRSAWPRDVDFLYTHICAYRIYYGDPFSLELYDKAEY